MADFTFAHREEGFDEHIEQSIRGYSHLLNELLNQCCGCSRFGRSAY